MGGKGVFKGERKILGKCSGSALARCACFPLHSYGQISMKGWLF